MISAIIVAHNEESLIENIIKELKKQQYKGSSEIILANGESNDNTVALAKKSNIRIVHCRKGKAKQMNDAVKIAENDILFFVHADMQLPNRTFAIIQEAIDKGYDGGGFSNQFDTHNARIKKLGALMNFRFFDKREQSDRGIFYGDNGIFVKKDVFHALGGFKEIPIMEDYDFSKRANTTYKFTTIKKPKITLSARRHIKAGFFKTRFQWIMIRKLYQWGVSPEKLANWYGDVR